jgi:hypothetical protein
VAALCAGLAPLFTVTTLLADVRVQRALTRSVSAISSLVSAVPQPEDAVPALLEAVDACLDASYDPRRTARAKALTERSAKDAAAAATAEAAELAAGGDAAGGIAPFLGSEAEQAAARSAYAIAGTVATSSLIAALALLSRLDLSSVAPAKACQVILSPAFLQVS